MSGYPNMSDYSQRPTPWWVTLAFIIVLTLGYGLLQTLIGEPSGCRLDSLSGEEIGSDC